MYIKSKTLLFAIMALFLSEITFTQEYRIRNFGVREGISHPFTYTLNQDTHGYIWIGTGEGLCRFNGTDFNTDVQQDSLSREVAGTSYKDHTGALWFGYQNGNIARYTGSHFETINTGVELRGSITGFAELDKNNLLASTLNQGVVVINRATGQAVKLTGTQSMMSTTLAVWNDILLLGTTDGLSLFTLDRKGNKAENPEVVKELEFVKIQDIQQSRDGKAFWLATEDQGVFMLIMKGDQYTLIKIGADQGIGNENAQSVFEDSEGQLWISTQRNGVFKLSRPDGKGNFEFVSHFTKDNGLAGNSIKRVYEDLEGNIFIATYGDGISELTGQSFTFLSYDYKGLDNNIQSVAVTADGTIYMGGMQGLFSQKMGQPAAKVNAIPSGRVTALALAKQGLLVGTEKNGLYALDLQTSAVKKIQYEANSLGNSVTSIAVYDLGLYLATGDGIYKFDKNFHETGHFTTLNQLPHNSIACVFMDSHNRLLFATRTNGVYQLNEKDEPVNLFPVGQSEIEFKSIAEDEEGGIWAATYGDGVYRFKNDSVYHITASLGLKNDYCYSIVNGMNHSMWTGHRVGISRINTENMRVTKYDMNMGITGDCNPNAVYKSTTGVLYFGTTEGLISYDPSKESKRKVPPFQNITRVLISDKAYDPDQKIAIVLPYKPYRLRIDYIGLNYRDPGSVRYQYKLEGHDLVWSDVTDATSAYYPRIEEGDYVFLLRSYNSDGLTNTDPVSVRINIRPPFWKTWWFITLAVLTLFMAVFIYVKIRERKQKLLQEYLETELAARTKEVVQQKEVIEIKNRDITDSINYAKRIQTSMLPPVKRLQQFFSGCFVFYHPRDIVSGDFYWFDQINENKFVVVCADSTGHGVPGAFMSMIGSTLIKDICTRVNGNSPSAVLRMLDCELRNTLNQNIEDGSSANDGMDIIVCEIDLKTHYMRFASAMRPMIIYRNGEEVFIKGSRNSVGGHYDKEDNIFEDEGIQLSKGDIIYMFSDGYSDQFGGPMGKKFKMVRLKNLLLDIHQKPMDEQFNHVKNTFNLWMENFEQVDDVLFMGIKI
jgi:ligand-binding sensor domain-containing protein/serine phosphatase RsbU (regulator of sigma subunit)